MKFLSDFNRWALFLIGYIALLAIVPTIIAPDPTLPNVAARGGYNIPLAYMLIAGWSVIGLVFFGFIRRPPGTGSGKLPVDVVPFCSATKPPSYLLNAPWLECMIVTALTLLLYWPPFLVRYGTYIEDTYFINVLWRMQCGQLPYRDFEFLYGPLMLYPAHFWMKFVGYSLKNYYWLIAILQATAMGLSFHLFQRGLPDFRKRWLAFVLFATFIFDSLLGLNYIGWRILPVLVALIVAASQPTKLRALIAGGLIGLQISYSYEYGIVAFIALAVVYASNGLAARKEQMERGQTAMLLAIYVLASCAASLFISLWLTDATFDDYTSSIAHTLRYASSTGMGSFRFYWTVNTIALFGLLSIAVIIVAGGFPFLRKRVMSPGDKVFLGALLFALGGLKIAIQRADIWHITLPFIPLVAAMLWQSKKNVFVIDRFKQRTIWILLVVAAVTRVVGLLPTASYFVSGVAKGARDSISAPTPSPVRNTLGQKSRLYSIQTEISRPDANIAALANYLADPERRERPVIFYGNLWELPVHSGVCPIGYSFYQLMYTNEWRPIIAELDQNRNTIVVIDASAYQRLVTGQLSSSVTAPLTTTKKLASWMSSIHYQQKGSESEIKFDLWKQNVGNYLLVNYYHSQRIGDMIVLERNPDTAEQIQ